MNKDARMRERGAMGNERSREEMRSAKTRSHALTSAPTEHAPQNCVTKKMRNAGGYARAAKRDMKRGKALWWIPDFVSAVNIVFGIINRLATPC